MDRFFGFIGIGGSCVFVYYLWILNSKVFGMTTWLKEHDQEVFNEVGFGGLSSSTKIQKYDLSTIKDASTKRQMRDFQLEISSMSRRSGIGLIVAVTIGFLGLFLNR